MNKYLLTVLSLIALTQAVSAAKVKYTLTLNGVQPHEVPEGLELSLPGNQSHMITLENLGHKHVFHIPDEDYKGTVTFQSDTTSSRCKEKKYSDYIEWLPFENGGTLHLDLEISRQGDKIVFSCEGDY